ncbi:MAG: hypothetical protein JWM43_2346 [Acidobacteriaceae bacterium]|nr:hypothetical protein [Acidobacteriaceae bacterium]
MLRRRHMPSGSSVSATSVPPRELPPGSDSRRAVVVTVEMVRVVLAAVLLPVKVSVAGEKLQDTPAGKVPQANAALPV